MGNTDKDKARFGCQHTETIEVEWLRAKENANTSELSVKATLVERQITKEWHTREIPFAFERERMGRILLTGNIQTRKQKAKHTATKKAQ